MNKDELWKIKELINKEDNRDVLELIKRLVEYQLEGMDLLEELVGRTK